MLEKNRLMSKRNDDLTQSLQRVEDKLKVLAKENLDMVRKTTVLSNSSLQPWSTGPTVLYD